VALATAWAWAGVWYPKIKIAAINNLMSILPVGAP